MSPPPRFTPRQRLAALLPAVLLLATAANQVRLVHQQNLTPWKGGGFGMYSTIDSGAARTVDIVLRTQRGDVRITSDQLARDWRLRRLAELVRYAPTEQRLDDLADRLIDTPLSDAAPAYQAAEPVTSVRITVWRYRYDPAYREFVPSRWMSVEKGAAP
jgi:hypothetical protein